MKISVRLLLGAMFMLAIGLAGVLGVRTALFTAPPLAAPPGLSTVTIDGKAAVRHLSEALRIRTLSPAPGKPVDGAAFARFRDFLSITYPAVHAAMRGEIVAGHSLLLTWPGRDPSLDPVLLSAHMDVVPAGPEEARRWTHPPFEGRVADGFVWGRGALDMKQSLIGILEAAEALVSAGFVPRRTVYLALTHDEETAGTGARAIAVLIEARGQRLHLTLDEGLMVTRGVMPGIELPVALIGIAQKGYLTVELSLEAAGGHSSMPPADPLAARLGRAVARLADDPPPARIGPPVDAMFRRLGPEMGLDRRLALANLWLLEPVVLGMLEEAPAANAMIRTTVAPTRLEALSPENVLPQRGRAVVNLRILPGDTVAGSLAYLERTVEGTGVAVHAVGAAWEPSRVVDTGTPAYRAIEGVVRATFPDALVAPGLMIALSDTRHYGRIARQSYFFTPSRMTGPDLDRMHGIDERTPVADLGEIVRFYATLIEQVSSE